MQLFRTLAHLFHPRRSNNHRPAVLHPQSLVVLASAAVIFTILFQPFFLLVLKHTGNVLGYASNITAADVVVMTNQERAKAGLPELTTNAKLNQAATAKAAHMFEQQYWAHVAPDGTQPWAFFKQANYSYRAAGENLARDFNNTDDMMKAWMASPTHRANIVNGRYQEIGVAVVDGTLLGTETTLVVQLFGSPMSAQAQVPAKAAAQVAQAPAIETKPAIAPAPTKTPTNDQFPPATPDTIGFAEPPVQNEGVARSNILGSGFFAFGSLQAPPLFSPLQLSKLFFLGIIFVIVTTLTYDTVVIGHRNTVRLVGKNFAHILLFLVVAYLLIFFKAGVVG